MDKNTKELLRQFGIKFNKPNCSLDKQLLSGVWEKTVDEVIPIFLKRFDIELINDIKSLYIMKLLVDSKHTTSDVIRFIIDHHRNEYHSNNVKFFNEIIYRVALSKESENEIKHISALQYQLARAATHKLTGEAYKNILESYENICRVCTHFKQVNADFDTLAVLFNTDITYAIHYLFIDSDYMNVHKISYTNRDGVPFNKWNKNRINDIKSYLDRLVNSSDIFTFTTACKYLQLFFGVMKYNIEENMTTYRYTRGVGDFYNEDSTVFSTIKNVNSLSDSILITLLNSNCTIKSIINFMFRNDYNIKDIINTLSRPIKRSTLSNIKQKYAKFNELI